MIAPRDLPLAIGIDLGGSNLRIAAVRGGVIDEATQHREPVGEPRDPDTVVARLHTLVEMTRHKAGAAEGDHVPVGIGIAAMLRDRRGTVANSPHLRWRDVAFGAQLAAKLGPLRPLGVYNDVNAITWGERELGAGAGVDDVLAVYVGTGIGAGVVSGGMLVEGATNCAGEIGHTKVRWDDDAAPCACGGRGCVEAYCGGSYVLARARRELADGARSLTLDLAGGVDHVTPGHVERAAEQGDAWALGFWSELAPLLGVALANAVTILNSARLILGGGMLGRTPILREQVIAAMMIALPNALAEPLEVVDAELGDDAGLVGAALLAARGISVIA
ncbi:MAG TPA: ROK family protein [Kofleriaceae bacterium]|nr:ROK family protein [Kofleriaceae bacterium]